MVGRTNVGGGGGKEFAFIAVTYPENAVCTCSDGTKTLKAKDTSGFYVFVVPNAATWSITITDGTDTKTKSVVIEDYGQFEELFIIFDLVLFDNGVIPAGGGFTAFNYMNIEDYNVGWNKPKAPTLTVGQTIIISGDTTAQSNNGSVFFNNAIDVTNYKTAKVNGSGSYNKTGGYGEVRISFSTNKADRFSKLASEILYNSTGLITFTNETKGTDITELSGSLYLVFTLLWNYNSSGNPTTTFNKIWLEA